MQFTKLTLKCISYNYPFASNIPSLVLVFVDAQVLDMGEDAGAELVAVGPVVVVVVDVAASASNILQGPEIR